MNMIEENPFLRDLMDAQGAGGSELGLGLSLFALSVSIRASTIVEIGRYKGFSTFALASALRLLDHGWKDKPEMQSRVDVNYSTLLKVGPRFVRSIDPAPTPEVFDLIDKHGLRSYVEFVNLKSADAEVPPSIDLLFIDGDHEHDACMADVNRYAPAVRPGGLIVMHDYFGWFDAHGRNGSRVRDVVRNITMTRFSQHVLVDTGYPSFVVLTKDDPRP